MNIFAFRPFKGKFNLGNSDDIPENQDGTLIGSVKEIKSALTDIKNVITGSSAGTYTNLLNGTYTQANPFICPTDGWVQLTGGSAQGMINVYSSNNVNLGSIGVWANGYNGGYVKKGMKLFPHANAPYWAGFFPFS